jgi:hypothetical protein
MGLMKRRTLILGAGGLGALAVAGAAAWRLDTGSMTEYARYQEALRRPIRADDGVEEVVRYAALAANSHNTQAWKFEIENAAIRLQPDRGRATPVVDPDEHHLYVSLGCAAENLALAAAATGRSGQWSFDGQGGMRFDHARGPAISGDLVAAVPFRQSTRRAYDPLSVESATLNAIVAQCRVEGVALSILTEPGAIDRGAELVAMANDRQMDDPAFVRELKRWLRFNPRSAMADGDGLFSAASGNPVLPAGVSDIAFWLAFTKSSENQRYRRLMAASAGIAIFSADVADHAHWVAVGRACQRFQLAATHAGLKTSFVNQPVEVSEYRTALAELSGLPGRRPDIVLRFGHGAPMPYSPRRPVGDILA